MFRVWKLVIFFKRFFAEKISIFHRLSTNIDFKFVSVPHFELIGALKCEAEYIYFISLQMMDFYFYGIGLSAAG